MRARDVLARSRLPRHEARRLLAAVVGVPVSRLDVERDLTVSQLERVETLEERRLGGVPLQYLEGTAQFGPFELVVDSRVLVPRPETEQLWELAVAEVEDPSVIVDVGTGSGALAVALAHRFPNSRVVATDVDPGALEVAKVNVERHGVVVELRLGDGFEALPAELRGRVDLLVSNPPYVTEGEWEGLAEDVKREPRVALVAGPRGTEVLERLLVGLGGWLAPSGMAAFEIGETQGEFLRRRAVELGWGAEVRRDMTGRDRFLVVRR